MLLVCYRLENNFEAFRERVTKCVRESLDNVYNPPTIDDPHYIAFDPYISELHDSIKQEIYEPKVHFKRMKMFSLYRVLIILCDAGRR